MEARTVGIEVHGLSRWWSLGSGLRIKGWAVTIWNNRKVASQEKAGSDGRKRAYERHNNRIRKRCVNYYDVSDGITAGSHFP